MIQRWHVVSMGVIDEVVAPYNFRSFLILTKASNNEDIGVPSIDQHRKDALLPCVSSVFHCKIIVARVEDNYPTLTLARKELKTHFSSCLQGNPAFEAYGAVIRTFHQILPNQSFVLGVGEEVSACRTVYRTDIEKNVSRWVLEPSRLRKSLDSS